MPQKPATSYGDIVAGTVPDPVGSFVPSREQIRAAQHTPDATFHPMTSAEHTLARSVRAAFVADGHVQLDGVEIVVQGTRVFLTGSVPGPSTIARLEDLAGKVHGVSQVISELQILTIP